MFKKVKNNRSIHSILANSHERNLKIRKLSCYCEKCLLSEYEECLSKALVENWEQIKLESERVERRATRADMNKQRERNVDLISSNSIVAIASGDVHEDYYLLKVLGNGAEVLSKSTMDDWGANVEVLRANFYVKENCWTACFSACYHQGSNSLHCHCQIYLFRINPNCTRQEVVFPSRTTALGHSGSAEWILTSLFLFQSRQPNVTQFP